MKRLFGDISKVKDRIRPLSQIIRSGAWILEGEEHSSGKHLKVMFSGSVVQKSYFSKLIFDSKCRESYLGKLYLWTLLFIITTNKKQCSLIVIQGNNILKSICATKNDFFIPTWLKSYVSLPLVPSNSSLKEDLRRIRKNKLGYKIAIDSAELSDFYQNMYLPMLNTRHGERAIGIEFKVMQKRLENGGVELLLITQFGKTIAGAIIIKDVVPRIWANGVRDANPVHSKSGAIGASYLFSSKHLLELGYTKMHLGMTRSFLDDGVLQYKKKLNNEIVGYQLEGFLLKPLILTDGLASFLINNPFVYLSGDTLISGIFKRRDKQFSDKEKKKIEKRYRLQGVPGFKIFSIAQDNGKIYSESESESYSK